MNPLPTGTPATSHPRRCRQGPLDPGGLFIVIVVVVHHHHHCMPPPPVTITGLVVAWCRLPPPSSSPLSSTADATPPTMASPPPRLVLLPPPSPSRPLRPLDRPWRRHGPACSVDTLRYDAASAAPARAPLFERRDNCASAAVTTAAMPRSPLRRLVLDLRFSGRRRQSGDGNGSTLTLTLIPGASGAATTTSDHPGNLRRLCSKFLLFCHQGLTGGASAMVR